MKRTVPRPGTRLTPRSAIELRTTSFTAPFIPPRGAVKWIRALGGTDYARRRHANPLRWSDGGYFRSEARPATAVGAQPSTTRAGPAQGRISLRRSSHELRNHLAPIRNAAEVASRLISLDSRAHAAIGIVKRQITQMSRLVDDMLDVSRISLGRVDIRMEVVELNNLIELAKETVAPLIRTKRHELSITPPREPVYVRGDSDRLVQALSNVLTNAAKYTGDHGQIRVLTETRGDLVAIEISDNGAGISADLLPRVFDLFTQSERTLDRAQGGVGDRALDRQAIDRDSRRSVRRAQRRDRPRIDL